MAKELVILAWCDPCQDQETRTEAKTYTLGMDGKTLTIEVCEKHGKPVETVLNLLRDYGQKPEDGAVPPPSRSHHKSPGSQPRTPQPRKPRGPYAKTRARLGDQTLEQSKILYCLLCPAQFLAQSGLTTHYETGHGIVAKELGGLSTMHGSVCPECGDEQGQALLLSRHLRAVHGIGHIAHAMGVGKDEYGVVAQVRKRLEELAGSTLL